MRRRHTALAVIIASLLALGTAQADPLTIRCGRVVMTSGYTPMVVAAKDQPYLFSTNDFYSDPSGTPDVGALQSGIDRMVSFGFAKESIDVKRYLDLSLVQEAAKRLPCPSRDF